MMVGEEIGLGSTKEERDHKISAANVSDEKITVPLRRFAKLYPKIQILVQNNIKKWQHLLSERSPSTLVI